MVWGICAHPQLSWLKSSGCDDFTRLCATAFSPSLHHPQLPITSHCTFLYTSRQTHITQHHYTTPHTRIVHTGRSYYITKHTRTPSHRTPTTSQPDTPIPSGIVYTHLISSVIEDPRILDRVWTTYVNNDGRHYIPGDGSQPRHRPGIL